MAVPAMAVQMVAAVVEGPVVQEEPEARERMQRLLQAVEVAVRAGAQMEFPLELAVMGPMELVPGHLEVVTRRLELGGRRRSCDCS